jgi:hypothetical protein
MMRPLIFSPAFDRARQYLAAWWQVFQVPFT